MGRQGRREMKTNLHRARLSVQEKYRAAKAITGWCYLSICILSGVWAEGEIMKQKGERFWVWNKDWQLESVSQKQEECLVKIEGFKSLGEERRDERRNDKRCTKLLGNEASSIKIIICNKSLYTKKVRGDRCTIHRRIKKSSGFVGLIEGSGGVDHLPVSFSKMAGNDKGSWQQRFGHDR